MSCPDHGALFHNAFFEGVAAVPNRTPPFRNSKVPARYRLPNQTVAHGRAKGNTPDPEKGLVGKGGSGSGGCSCGSRAGGPPGRRTNGNPLSLDGVPGTRGTLPKRVLCKSCRRSGQEPPIPVIGSFGAVTCS